MLELKGIYTSFNKGTIDEMQLFRDFNFSVKKGEFISVVGSNGSGKTTLLNLICGTVRPDAGSIIFKDADITRLPEHKRAKNISRVFQDPKMGTCGNLTVLENFALADNKNRLYGLTGAINKRRIDFYRERLSLCNMGLEDRMNTQVGMLSGGQRQAIALVISGITSADLLILDEHTAALDPKSSETVMEITDRLISSGGMTAVMVTHNLRFATTYGNRIIMMHNGEVVLDEAGEKKESVSINKLLGIFNEISIECGN